MRLREKEEYLTQEQRSAYLKELSDFQRETLFKYKRYKINSDLITKINQSGNHWILIQEKEYPEYNVHRPLDSPLICNCGKHVKFLFTCEASDTGEIRQFGRNHLEQEARIPAKVVRQVKQLQLEIDRGTDAIINMYHYGHRYPTRLIARAKAYQAMPTYSKKLEMLDEFKKANLPLYKEDFNQLRSAVRKQELELIHKLQEKQEARRRKEEQKRLEIEQAEWEKREAERIKAKKEAEERRREQARLLEEQERLEKEKQKREKEERLAKIKAKYSSPELGAAIANHNQKVLADLDTLWNHIMMQTPQYNHTTITDKVACYCVFNRSLLPTPGMHLHTPTEIRNDAIKLATQDENFLTTKIYYQTKTRLLKHSIQYAVKNLISWLTEIEIIGFDKNGELIYLGK